MSVRYRVGVAFVFSTRRMLSYRVKALPILRDAHLKIAAVFEAPLSSFKRSEERSRLQPQFRAYQQ